MWRCRRILWCTFCSVRCPLSAHRGHSVECSFPRIADIGKAGVTSQKRSFVHDLADVGSAPFAAAPPALLECPLWVGSRQSGCLIGGRFGRTEASPRKSTKRLL